MLRKGQGLSYKKKFNVYGIVNPKIFVAIGCNYITNKYSLKILTFEFGRECDLRLIGL